MEQEERLHKLYEQGLTSIEEERALIRMQSESRGQRNLWFDYIRFKRNLPSADIEMQVLERIKVEQYKHRKLFISLVSAAASILIITVFTATHIWNETTGKNREIVAAFEEALLMIPDNSANTSTEAIIYEDESIIIYIEK